MKLRRDRPSHDRLRRDRSRGAGRGGERAPGAALGATRAALEAGALACLEAGCLGDPLLVEPVAWMGRNW